LNIFLIHKPHQEYESYSEDRKSYKENAIIIMKNVERGRESS